jgi:methylamine dehydrogenase accessory protein MauD
MVEGLLVSQIILWTVVIAMAAVILGLSRQIGVLHERVAPLGALTIDRGPQVGEKSPIFEIPDLRGKLIRVGGANESGRSLLVIFVSPTCPVCKKLLPTIKSIALAERRWLDVALSSDGDRAENSKFAATERLEGFPYLLSSEIGLAYQIGKLPYALLIDHVGVVKGKGLVNTREHLESIIEAKQMGVASLQEYLKGRHEQGVGMQPTAERGK